MDEEEHEANDGAEASLLPPPGLEMLVDGNKKNGGKIKVSRRLHFLGEDEWRESNGRRNIGGS